MNIKRFDIGKLFLGYVVVLGLMITIYLFIDAFKAARDAEVRTDISAIETALEAYREEYHSYSDSLREIGFYPEGDTGSKFYLDAEEVPKDIFSKLAESEQPFGGKLSYRILVVKPDKIYVKELGKELFTRDF